MKKPIRRNRIGVSRVYKNLKHKRNRNIHRKIAYTDNCINHARVMDILNKISILILAIFMLFVINNCYHDDNIDPLIEYYSIDSVYEDPSDKSFFGLKMKHDSMKVQSVNYKEHSFKNRNNESIILDKLRDLHLKQALANHHCGNQKVLELEDQINKNKESLDNLIKDINIIIKEHKP